MIAYHFPPQKGSSGIQRTLRFCRYLPDEGWTPVVLTVTTNAYEKVDDDLIQDVPKQTPVLRAFAINAARKFSIAGRYPWFIALPDRWASWTVAGVMSGLMAVRRYRPRVIWSTYPIATAHLIAYVLHRLTGIPWIADFRDPMAQEGYPPDPRVWRVFRWIEGKAFKHAAACLFTSPSAIKDYLRTYPHIHAQRLILLENGYDEEVFANISRADVNGKREGRRLLLLHSGIVYTKERDPTSFFRALGELKRRNILSAEQIEIRFRASANDALLAELAQKNDINDLITIAPSLPYGEALHEMAGADALLVMQAANCNSQIPAKVYEYLRVSRPILALTDVHGDTADLLKRASVSDILSLESTEAIVAGLPLFLDKLRNGQVKLADIDFVRSCSRRSRTAELAAVFTRVDKSSLR